MKNENSREVFEKESQKLSKYYSENLVPTHTIDRTVVILRKKQPYIDWIRRLPDPDLETTLEEINREPSTYLIPSCEDNIGLLAHLCSVCHEIFAVEMSGWWTDEQDWEKDLSFENFNCWFDYEISTLPIDLGEGEIFRNEY